MPFIVVVLISGICCTHVVNLDTWLLFYIPGGSFRFAGRVAGLQWQFQKKENLYMDENEWDENWLVQN